MKIWNLFNFVEFEMEIVRGFQRGVLRREKDRIEKGKERKKEEGIRFWILFCFL